MSVGNFRERSGLHNHISRSQWHRKLCVMVWILEAMQLDSPLHAIPLAKCWNLDCKYVDEVGRRRVHERNQLLLKQWQQLYLDVKVGYRGFAKKILF